MQELRQTNQQYSITKIRQAITSNVKHSIYLSCKQAGNTNYLVEVGICFNLQLHLGNCRNIGCQGKFDVVFINISYVYIY